MLGVQTDNVDELRAQMAPLAAEVVLAGAGQEMAEDEAHLLTGDVVAATETWWMCNYCGQPGSDPKKHQFGYSDKQKLLACDTVDGISVTITYF